jgi:hypothetical protein
VFNNNNSQIRITCSCERSASELTASFVALTKIAGEKTNLFSKTSDLYRAIQGQTQNKQTHLQINVSSPRIGSAAFVRNSQTVLPKLNLTKAGTSSKQMLQGKKA